MIQPTCMRPEKNIKIEISLEPIPQVTATIRFNSRIPIRRAKFNNSIKGMTFCHVRKIKAFPFLKFTIRAAPQK